MSNRKSNKDSRESNRPFDQLSKLVKNAGLRLRTDVKPPVQKVTLRNGEDEDDIFERAMEGVTRISRQNDPAIPTKLRPEPFHDPESEDLRLLQEVVSGKATPSIDHHPEYIEGWVGVAGKKYLPNLRNGMYSIQDQIDLHGLSREEARNSVEEFIKDKSHYSACCVKIIHGRGINSFNDRAILKESLQRWLSTRRMARYVVAYASAPFSDGGVGAVYVLVRRSRAG
jgi:DNA-nicking Smr family endonuclease